jgi:hypothetical protein
MNSKIYTINQGNKTLSTIHNDKHYIIGFKNIFQARAVHYTLNPNPNIILSRSKDYSLLFISKCDGSIWNPINEAGFYLKEYCENEILTFPEKKQLGIIIVTEIEDETDKSFVFKSDIMDPLF